MTKRYHLLCAVSGMGWAVIAYYMGGTWRGSAFWGGLVSAPLIGVVVGMIYRPAYRFPFFGRVAMSLLTLYLSAVLFGVAWGVTDAIQGLPGGVPRNTIEVVYQGVAATFFGVTATGFVVFLWPLAHLNHWFVGKFVGGHLPAGPPSSNSGSHVEEN